ncbi:transposase-like protein [Hirsutella rhossiliensis]|uniref:Transposase-like protein n=1 Tax=Hirsutella rhossiliensis TaxID=111463 RepID=A0A9P8NAC2_9HYPO|nr:transposase-like protein [Hirsutella rhossiliensis]KAH0968906.1 transposase-like protein [Hirsutella rhossiliensis]
MANGNNWTSPNHLGVIGFTVQFVTEDHAIMEFVREYGISSKIGYFMMDNASNMNTMIDKVSDDLEREFDVFYDPLQHRLRCFGHIINLAVMEFLIGLSDGLRLRRDNDTRWNSWYNMVEWVLRPKIRQAITVFCSEEPALQEDALHPCDWIVLAEIHKFLEPFHDATIANESWKKSISDVLPTMDYLCTISKQPEIRAIYLT